MSAQSEVPIFYMGQDDSEESPCRVIPRTEARQLKKQGLGYFECHGRQFRLFEECPKVVEFLPPSGTAQPSTISFPEMLANVGITEEWERYPLAAVRRAQEKIRLYPFVGDAQAPLARIYS